MSHWQIGPVYGMEDEKDSLQDGQLNNLVAPVAITLALIGLTFAASSLEGREVDGDFISTVSLISLSVLVPACVGRSSGLIPLGSGVIRIGAITLGAALIGLIANSVDPEKQPQLVYLEDLRIMNLK